MRTTLVIDDDLLSAARSLARTRSETVGRVLSDLARRGLAATPRVEKSGGPGGFPVFRVPPDAHPITLEDVRRLEDEI
ncbi:MAG: antitoxin [Candidatus Omnitrophica bacterium]|nr:antitoxin [Candidatus Omnitrophota bacterium]